jgi:hypothetical protein
MFKVFLRRDGLRLVLLTSEGFVKVVLCFLEILLRKTRGKYIWMMENAFWEVQGPRQKFKEILNGIWESEKLIKNKISLSSLSTSVDSYVSRLRQLCLSFQKPPKLKADKRKIPASFILCFDINWQMFTL